VSGRVTAYPKKETDMQAKKELQTFSQLARLNELQERLYQDFFAVAEEIGRLKADLEWERKAIFDIGQKQALSETVSQKEAAKHVHYSIGALSRAATMLEEDPEYDGPLACLARSRILNGGKIEYLRIVLERHRSNILNGNKCGSCYLIAKSLLHAVKKK
jgi:hypothetical protein